MKDVIAFDENGYYQVRITASQYKKAKALNRVIYKGDQTFVALDDQSVIKMKGAKE